MSQGLRRIVLESLFWGVGAKGVLLVANMAVLMITSHMLSPTEFGVFAIAIMVTDLAWALSSSAIGVALVQKKDLTDDERNAGFFCFLGLGLVLSIASVLAAPLLAFLFEASEVRRVLPVFAAFMPFKLVAGYYGACLQRDLDLRYYQLSQNLPQLLGGALLTAVGTWLGWGIWALVVGSGVSTLMEFGMTVSRSKWCIAWSLQPSAYRALLARGNAPLLNRLVAFTAGNVDRAITGWMLGSAVLGAYTRAYNLMMVPVRLIGLTLNRTLLPVFARLQDDQRRLTHALEEVITVQTLISLPIGVGLFLSAPQLVAWVLGKQWSMLVPAAQVLFLALCGRLGYIGVETASIAIGEAGKATRRNAAYAAAVATGATIGCSFGITGVSIGVSLAVMFLYGLSLVYAVRRFRCSGKLLAIAHLRAVGVAGMSVVLALSFDRWLVAAVYWIVLGVALLCAPVIVVGTVFANARQSCWALVLKRTSR